MEWGGVASRHYSQSLSQPGGGSTTISVVKMCSCFEMSGDIPPCFGVFVLLFIFNTFSYQGIVLWLNMVVFHLLQMQNSGWFRARENEKLTQVYISSKQEMISRLVH